MSKCLVTGGAGFIGSHVVDALLEAGHEVTVLDNLSTGKEENLNLSATVIPNDIRYKSTFSNLDKFDYVFHLAALARIQPSIQDPLPSHDTNVNGTLNVLEYCRKSGAKLIFSGSSSIYQGDRLPTREADAKSPKNPYALQKLQCEQYIMLYHELYGLKYTILRYFNVYGERQILDGAYAAVIGIFLDQKKRGVPLTITGDGEQRRDFTYVKDVAKANLMAMEWEGTFNIGTGKNRSMNEIAATVGGEVEHLSARIGEVQATQADNSKARAKGWAPTKDVLDWIHDTQR